MSKKIIFWGTPDFALPILEVLRQKNLVTAVVTRPDREQGRGRVVASGPVAQVAAAADIPLLQPEKLDAEFLQALTAFLPATFFIVAYGKLIPQRILDLSELPALNIHPSLLPELRGPSPLQTALLQGRSTTGVSLMQLDAEMDHGPIVAQEKIEITSSDYLPELSRKAAECGAKLTEQHIQDYLAGQLKSFAQDDHAATFCSMITKEDGLLDWTQSAKMIRDKIRAFTPWPSAYFVLSGQQYKIIRAEILPYKVDPGVFVFRDKKLMVGTTTDALEIREVQPAGKSIMSGQAFYNGYQSILTSR